MEIVLNMTKPTYKGDFIIINKFIHQNEVLDSDMLLVNNTGRIRKIDPNFKQKLNTLKSLMKTNYTAYLEKIREVKPIESPIFIFQTNETKTNAVVNVNMARDKMTQEEEDADFASGNKRSELFEIKMNRPLENAYPGAYGEVFLKLRKR